jgi:tetratricopeptide (TPR) repeat protein
VRFDEELPRRGYEEGLGVPLGLKQEVAQRAGAGYVLSGHVGTTEGGQVLLETELRETETGALTAEHRFEAETLFDAIDRASAQLKRDLGLPDGHLESTTDLPVTQVFTSSVAAAKHYAQGHHFQQFGEDSSRRAAQEYGRATSADTTFALGYLREGEALWRLGKREQAREMFGSAQRHSYRLPESRKYELKALRLYRLEGQPEAALQVCERWTSLHPYDLDGWKTKASIQLSLLQYEQALASCQRTLELAPESKSIRRIISEMLMRPGQLENALQRAKSYAESYPKDESGPLLVGRIYWRRGELERAERAFRRAERMDARDARTHLLALNQAQGQFEAALSRIEKEASDGQDRVQVGLRLSHHHWLRGRISRSQEVLDSLWTDGPRGPGGIYRYSLAVRACDYRGPLGQRSYISELLGRLQTLWQESSTGTPGYEITAQSALARCKTAVGKL